MFAKQPASGPPDTNILQLFGGSNFPNENTGVDGTFSFYNGGNLVAQFGYYSTTSGQLASYAAVFPPNNGSFTFDSFTNDLNIDDLTTPATLDSSAFFYDLVSAAQVPEPGSLAFLGAALAALGGLAMRRKLV